MNEKQETGLVKQEKKLPINIDISSGMVPSTYNELLQFAGLYHNSGLAPKSLDTVQKVAIAMGMCIELGIPILTSIQDMAVINQKVGIYGDAALALVRKSGQLEYLKEEEAGTPYSDDWTFTCEIKRKGATARTGKWTWEDAKRAGFDNPMRRDGQTKDTHSPWRRFTRRMMQFKARNFPLRDEFGDILKGMKVAEDLQDAIDITETAQDITKPAPPEDENVYGIEPEETGETKPEPEKVPEKEPAEETGGMQGGNPNCRHLTCTEKDGYWVCDDCGAKEKVMPKPSIEPEEEPGEETWNCVKQGAHLMEKQDDGSYKCTVCGDMRPAKSKEPAEEPWDSEKECEAERQKEEIRQELVKTRKEFINIYKEDSIRAKAKELDGDTSEWPDIPLDVGRTKTERAMTLLDWWVKRVEDSIPGHTYVIGQGIVPIETPEPVQEEAEAGKEELPLNGEFVQCLVNGQDTPKYDCVNNCWRGDQYHNQCTVFQEKWGQKEGEDSEELKAKKKQFDFFRNEFGDETWPKVRESILKIHFEGKTLKELNLEEINAFLSQCNRHLDEYVARGGK